MLTDPEELLRAFESSDLSSEARKALVLFAETLPFDGDQRRRLVTRLRDYFMEHRSSADEDDLVAVGSAARKLIAYWTASQLDELAALLQYERRPLAREAELEVAKALVYRFSWDPAAAEVQSPRLCDALYELARFYSSKRALTEAVSGAIALNAILGLAFIKDSRAVELATSLPKGSPRWLVSLVRSRVARLVGRQANQKSESLGLLPDVLRAVSTIASSPHHERIGS